MARSFRIVASARRLHSVLDFLACEGFTSGALPFSPFCRLLADEPKALGASLAAFFGYIYIQDKASMLPPLALAPPSGAAALDMCASPGGKATFLGQLCGENGFVLANEPPGTRLCTLRANILRASLPQVASCVYDGRKIPLLPNSLSHILLDAPCSGWGTTEKNPLAPKIWRGKKIDGLLALQRALLHRAQALLEPGGLLLYSTCTTNSEENDAQIRRALGEYDLDLVPLAPFPGFQFEDGLAGALRVDGAASGSQGFYLALLRKKGNLERTAGKTPHEQASSPQAITDVLTFPPEARAALYGGMARFVPAAARFLLPEDFIWQGYPLGRLRDGHFAPEPRLHVFLRPHLPALRLDDTEDIRGILAGRGKNTGLSGTFAVLLWHDLPLGFIRLKNGRAISAFR